MKRLKRIISFLSIICFLFISIQDIKCFFHHSFSSSCNHSEMVYSEHNTVPEKVQVYLEISRAKCFDIQKVFQALPSMASIRIEPLSNHRLPWLNILTQSNSAMTDWLITKPSPDHISVKSTQLPLAIKTRLNC